jgi:hypothetical protein
LTCEELEETVAHASGGVGGERGVEFASGLHVREEEF